MSVIPLMRSLCVKTKVIHDIAPFVTTYVIAVIFDLAVTFPVVYRLIIFLPLIIDKLYPVS